MFPLSLPKFPLAFKLAFLSRPSICSLYDKIITIYTLPLARLGIFSNFYFTPFPPLWLCQRLLVPNAAKKHVANLRFPAQVRNVEISKKRLGVAAKK